jgi:DNA-binding NtrC family response regulator
MRPTDSFSRVASIARELVGLEVLVIDRDERIHRGMTQVLSAEGLHVTCDADPEAALARVDRQFFSVVLVDLDTPTAGAGLDTLRALRTRTPSSMLIALLSRRSFDDAVAAVRAGAIDLVPKSPDEVQHLADRVHQAAGRSVGQREVDSVLLELRDVHEELLQRFMGAEKRAVDLQDQLAGKQPDELVDVGELAVLIVDEDTALTEALLRAAPAGFAFTHAASGGEALDRASSRTFHYAMVSLDLHDLPTSLVVRSVRTQSPETVLLQFRAPGADGRVELVESAGVRPIIEPFAAPDQLLGRLDELAEAFRARARERRYLQAFRERHFDFLRRYVELKTRIDRALNEGPG